MSRAARATVGPRGFGKMRADCTRHGPAPGPLPGQPTDQREVRVTANRAAARREKRSSAPLLKVKLSQPHPGTQILERARLLQALRDNAERPLTLVIADAGFGKTTLLATWTRGLRRPVVWYSLMPSDADVVVFGRYLLEGFRREQPRFGADVERALDEARPGDRFAEVLGGTLANALAALRGPAQLLVLDDFQEVAGDRQVVRMMDTLVRHLPEGLRIVIAARSAPPLALERMRARGEIFELNSSHLRMTRAELGTLFAEVYGRPLADPELAALDETTLGWPTAVHLAHESLRRADGVGLEQVLADFRTSNLELHDYLSSEVYARLDARSRRLLERTAAVSRFDAGLAEALAGLRDPRPVLEGLVRRGLLRAFGRGPRASWEVHDLVRRFVCHEIEKAGGVETMRELEADTARTLAGRGAPEQALRHFLLAGHADEAAALLGELSGPLLREGRASALLQYLGDLPARFTRDNLELAVTLADAQQAVGAWDEAETLYQDLLERCRRAGARRIECRALIGLGKVLNLRGRHEQVLGMAERGLAVAHDLGLELRVRLLQMKAGAHFYLGQYQAAVDVLDQVRSLLGPAGDPELLLPTVHNLAGAYAAQGRFREASEQFRAALSQVRGTSSPRAPLYLSNLAFHLAELGELAEARRAAEEGLAAAQRFTNHAQECACHEALAQIQALSGDLDAALISARRADELNAELRMEAVATDLLALRGRIFLARGEYRRAVEFVNQAIERSSARPDDPRLTEFRSTLAWCELRSGRVHLARDLLLSLLGRADAGENEFQRMRVHYWLGEALLALGEQGADAHLEVALRLVLARGYLHFLKVQAREEPAPLLDALARGIEVDVVAAALVEAGGAIEERLLALAAEAPTRVGEAVVAVLAEVGRSDSRRKLGLLSKTRRALQPAIAAALRSIDGRIARGRAVAPDAEPARLTLFGPPRLHVGGQPVPAPAWRAQRAFQLLVYLALQPRGASRDELLERFWPGRRAAAGRRNFHPTLSYIRAVLPRAGVAPILREGSQYRLDPAYPLTCDAWDLDRALEAARGARGLPERRTALERAATLVAGSFLEGFYADWADEQQARTRDRIEKLMLDLGGVCARQQDFEAALAAFRRASEIDAYREATRLAVIECLLRIGQRRAALVEWEKLRALLRAELSVDPLPESEEAMRSLLAGRGVQGWPGSPARATEHDGAQSVERSSQAPIKSGTASS